MSDNARVCMLAALGWLLLLVQASTWFPLEIRWCRPDLLLILVVVTAIRAPRGRGAGLCWAIGYGVEVLSGMHGGLWQLFFLGIFFLIRLLKKFFHFQTVLNCWLLLLVCQTVKCGYLLFLLYSVYEYRYSGFAGVWLRETLLTLLIFPAAYVPLQRLTAAPQEPVFVQRPIYHGSRIR